MLEFIQRRATVVFPLIAIALYSSFLQHKAGYYLCVFNEWIKRKHSLVNVYGMESIQSSKIALDNECFRIESDGGGSLNIWLSLCLTNSLSIFVSSWRSILIWSTVVGLLVVNYPSG